MQQPQFKQTKILINPKIFVKKLKKMEQVILKKVYRRK
jgi:hypothetical protein